MSISFAEDPVICYDVLQNAGIPPTVHNCSGASVVEAVEPDLVLARRHVAEGEARIEAQRQLIERLEDAGPPTDLAEQLLASLHATMTQMRARRDFLERAARGD